MKLYKLCVFSLVGIFSVSWSSTLKKSLDPKTGLLPTTQTLEQSEVLVEKPIDLSSHNQFLYIKNSGVNMEKYNKYVVGTLRNIGRFERVYTQSALEKYLIENKLTDKMTSISDTIGLLNLQKQIGNYLVCECTPEYLGGYNSSFKFKIINPATAERILELKRQLLTFLAWTDRYSILSITTTSMG